MRVISRVLHRDHARAMLGSARIKDHLKNLILKIIRQHRFQYPLGGWFKNVSKQWITWGLRLVLWKFTVLNRQKRLHRRPLINRVDKVGVNHRNLVDFSSEKFFRRELGDRLGFDKGRRVLQLEIGEQLALCPRQELACLSANRDVAGLACFKTRRLAQQVRVERARQAFVGTDNDHQFLFYFAYLEQGMKSGIGPLLQRNQHLV